VESTDPQDDFINQNKEPDNVLSDAEKVISVFTYQLFAVQSVFFISDNVVGVILKIVHLFLSLLYKIMALTQLENIMNLFPSTLFKALIWRITASENMYVVHRVVLCIVQILAQRLQEMAKKKVNYAVLYDIPIIAKNFLE